jgi:tetratricopeptide (TPR) repeat protein
MTTTIHQRLDRRLTKLCHLFLAFLSLVVSARAEEPRGWGGAWKEHAQEEKAVHTAWNQARAAILARHFAVAAEACSQIVKDVPGSWKVRYVRALAYAAEGNNEKALADSQEVIQIIGTRSPSDRAVGLTARAAIYRSMHNYQRARADLEQALVLDKDAWQENQLADFLANCPDAAQRDGKRALSLARDCNERTRFRDPSYLDTLAEAEAEAGDFNNAIKHQEQALALDKAKKLNASAVRRLELYRAHQPYRDDRSAAQRLVDSIRNINPAS